MGGVMQLSRRRLIGGVVGVGASAAGLALAEGCDRLLGAPRKAARVAYLGNAPWDSPDLFDAFRRGLRELGWVEG